VAHGFPSTAKRAIEKTLPAKKLPYKVVVEKPVTAASEHSASWPIAPWWRRLDRARSESHYSILMRVAQWHRRSLPDLLRNRDQIRGAFTRPLSENGRRLADSPTVSRRKSHRNRGSSQKKPRRNDLCSTPWGQKLRMFTSAHKRQRKENPPRSLRAENPAGSATPRKKWPKPLKRDWKKYRRK